MSYSTQIYIKTERTYFNLQQIEKKKEEKKLQILGQLTNPPGIFVFAPIERFKYNFFHQKKKKRIQFTVYQLQVYKVEMHVAAV